MPTHRRLRHAIGLTFVAVALVVGMLFAQPFAGSATTPSTVTLQVGHVDNMGFPKTVIRSCASSDTSVAQCSLIPHVTSTARILCLKTGSAVITVLKKTPERAQPVTCLPSSNTRDFTNTGPRVFDVPITSCTTTNPAIVCFLPTRNRSRPNRVTLLCRNVTNPPATFTVRILDASYTYPTVCDQPSPSSFTVTVGRSRSVGLPGHLHRGTWWSGISAHGCVSSNHAIGHCWQHSDQGLLMHCSAVGNVVLTLEGVRGGNMQLSLDCVK